MKKLISLLLLLPLFTHAQIITTIVGTSVSGHTGDGGMADTATLFHPDMIAFDTAGNMYIADGNNYCIRKVSTSGTISTIIGNATSGYSGDGGPATAAQFGAIPGFAIDKAGNIFVADDDNQRIRKVDPAGIVTTFAGTGVSGYSGDGGPATAASIHNPNFLAIDDSGNLLISDLLNNCIRKVNTAGIITTIAGNGTAGYSGDGGPATAALLKYTTGVAADGIGNIYILDLYNYRIRMINTAGIISTIAGNGTIGYSGDGGPADSAQFSGQAQNVSLDGVGNLYFADWGNSVIRKIDLFTGIISTVAGNDTAGFSGDGGLATACELDGPAHIGFDGHSNGYVSDYFNNRIRKIAGLVPAIIYGPGNVCTGDNITLTDPQSAGTWSSSDTSVAKVNSGIVTGIAAGTATITYAFDTSSVTQVVTVNPLPDQITGRDGFCWGTIDTLTDSTVGGIWSSNATINAIVGSGSGFVSAGAGFGSPDSATITYTLNTGCSASLLVYVYTLCGDGIPTISNNSEISIFPNPAYDKIVIQSPKQPIDQISITNLIGQTVYLQASPALGQQEQVDVSGLPAGVYFIKVNASEVRKFIKE